MATKFSQIYKQELKNKGVLSSLGSAALKQTQQRMDIRNTLFGGSGVLSLAGQKIFGKGYSPLEKASGILSSSPTSTSSGANSQGITDLLASSDRQETLLRVISKNTFNMNMMARDTNITRQNIVSLTKQVTGKSSRSQDALWSGFKARNAKVDLLTQKKNERSQPGNTTPTNTGGSSSFLGSIMSGLGTLGSIGGGILSGLFGVISRMSPILAIIGLAGAAYVIKEIASQVDFTGLKKSIMDAIGLDSESDEPILKQLAKKLDSALGLDSKPFGSFYEFLENSPFMKKLGNKIDEIAKTANDYTIAAFRTLVDGFGKVGEIFSYYFGEFFNANKGLILGVMGASIGSLLGIKGAAAGALIGAIVGAATGNKDLAGLTSEQFEKQMILDKEVGIRDKLIEDEATLGIVDKARLTDYKTGARGKAIKYYQDRIGELQTEIESKKGEQKKLMSFDTGARFNTNLANVQGTSGSSPSQVPSSDMIKLIYSKFKEAGFNDAQTKGAIANAIAESNLNPNAKNITDKEESYGLFQINRKAHPEFSAGDLVDPVKNIDAMIKIMKKDSNSYNAFKGLNDEKSATEYFMKKFEKPKDQSDAKVAGRIQNLNRIPGDILNSSSRALADASRSDTSASNINVMTAPAAAPAQPAKPQNATASVHNFDPWVEIWGASILNPAKMGM
jgi:hypothetical protein